MVVGGVAFDVPCHSYRLLIAALVIAILLLAANALGY